MEQVRVSEQLFALLRRLRPSQRVVNIALCRVLTPALRAVDSPRAEVLAEVIDVVCARFDSKGRIRR